MHKSFKMGPQSGFTLLEVMVTAAIMGILAMVTTSMMTMQAKHMGKIDRDMDIFALKTAIIQNVNCRVTTYAVCVKDKNQLYGSKRTVRFTNARMEREGASKRSKGVSHNMLGNARSTGGKGKAYWAFDATCDEGTVKIRYTRKKKDGSPALEPVGRTPYEWKDLFETPICQRSAEAWSKCPPGKSVSAINLETGQIRCSS